MSLLVVDVLSFTRYMDYSLGLAFAKAAKKQTIKEAIEDEELTQLITDAIVWRPAQLHGKLLESLVKQLVVIADEFEDEKLFLLMLSILQAASGDYRGLLIIAEEEKVLGVRASEYMFDQETIDV